MDIKDSIPLLDLKEFRFKQEDGESFLYHEIHGENRIEKPHKHDFFLFLLFEKGSGIHTIDFQDYNVDQHQMHMLFPDQVHHWHLKKNTAAYQLMMSRDVFETFSASLRFSFALYHNHQVLKLSPNAFETILHEFKAIKKVLDAKPVSWDIIHLRSRLIALMVSREAENKFEDLLIYNTKPVLYKYHTLIDQCFKEQKSVAFYADNLNISANYLNILCKKHLKVPATYLIHTRVILEAKRRIQATNNSLKEISFELGFKDPAYFSHFFKTQTGISPRQFREQL